MRGCRFTIELFESLETRQLLTAALNGSTLTIVGTPKADIVVLNQTATSVLVSENGGAAQAFDASQIQQIQIDLGSGDDQVSLQKKNGSQALRIPAAILGGKGNDYLRGGSANDTLSGGAGDDTMDGGAGADSMIGGAGNDTADYSSRVNPLSISLDSTANDGEAGENDNVTTSVETVLAGSGNDTVSGDPADNLIDLGPGNDTVESDETSNDGAGNDTLLGGPGDDTFFHDAGADLVIGGDGNDTMFFATPFNQDGFYVNLDGLPNDGTPGEGDNIQVDNIFGGDGNDTLIGDDGDNSLDGGGGANNSIVGNGGNDTLSVDLGIDGDFGSGVMFGGDGNDLMQNTSLDGGATEMHGGAGDDRMFPTFKTTVVTGDAGNDYVNYQKVFQPSNTIDLRGSGLETVVGSNGPDMIIGDETNEVILGEVGDDTILGNGGDDYIDGGGGHDSLSGGAGNDTIVNADGGEPDTVDGGDGFDVAQFDGYLITDPVLIPNDTIENVEFIYDPSTTPAPGSSPPPQVQGVRALAVVASTAAPVIPLGGAIVGKTLTIVGQTSNLGAPIADSISVLLNKTGTRISITQNGFSTSFLKRLIHGIFIDAGGGNDSIALMRSDGSRAVPISATISGGNGNDAITGGAGNDSLVGGKGNDTLLGAGGDDLLNGGSDAVTTGPDGADYISGGPGNDTVVYSSRTDNLNIDLSDGTKANDGAIGEGDSVQPDVENVFGGSGNDVIVGNDASNLLSGGAGADTLKGGAGNDKLIGSRDSDVLLGQGDLNLYSIADGEADDFDAALDAQGHPINAFVSGDPQMDYSTVSNKVLQ